MRKKCAKWSKTIRRAEMDGSLIPGPALVHGQCDVSAGVLGWSKKDDYALNPSECSMILPRCPANVVLADSIGTLP